MLHEFIASNRDELIARCHGKAAQRRNTGSFIDTAANGAPLFLAQLVETLRRESTDAPIETPAPKASSVPTDIGTAAALHGAELLRRGYTVDLVVHDYGDICQSVTELAMERSAPITTNEFRILNRSLDDAIADAVTAYGRDRQESVVTQANAIGDHIDYFSHAQKGLLDTAIQTFAALQTGAVGLGGATARAHLDSLQALKALTDQSVSAVRLASALSTLEPPTRH